MFSLRANDSLEPDDAEATSLLTTGHGGSRARSSTNIASSADIRGGSLAAHAKVSSVGSNADMGDDDETKTQAVGQSQQLIPRCVRRSSLHAVVINAKFHLALLWRGPTFHCRLTHMLGWHWADFNHSAALGISRALAAIVSRAVTAWHIC